MPKPSRHQARILAFRTIYSRHKLGVNPNGENHLVIESGLQGKYKDFSQDLTNSTWERLNEIDGIIQKVLKNWKQHRISDTLNALLRISIGEMLHYKETESNIIINEAIEICKKFVDEKATKICNGVLHSASKEIRVEQ
jgi:N utilization substance protein B